MKRVSRNYAGLNAHRLVAAVAIEMAQELFEVYVRDNGVYRKLRADGQVTEKAARRLFVERVAPRLLEDARAQLASMLGPDAPTCEYTKEQIYEALCLDSDLRANRFVAESQAVIPSTMH